MKRNFLFFSFLIYAGAAYHVNAQSLLNKEREATPVQDALQAPLDAAQVFEWWDDGIVTPEEANEIFSRLEEGNYDEACLLAEVYAQEPCIDNTQNKPKHSKKRKGTRTQAQPPNMQSKVSVIPHGSLSWKGQYNSDGHLKKQRKELQVQFYYFKLRLGSQELLSYHRDGHEANFGQISTLELHSHLPLDTLWGTAILYTVGRFKFGALFDTSKTFHAHVDFKPNRQNEIGATLWKFPDAGAISMQVQTTLGQISAWYQFGQNHPLVKIQLQSKKNRLSWKTTAYVHGDSIPQGLNMSKGIAENRLWASQTVNVQWPEALNTVFSAKARVLSPIASDSLSARFKLSLASGTDRLRPSLSVTCIEAGDNCSSTEWKGSVETLWERLTFKAGAKFRLASDIKPPKIELSASFAPSRAFAKLTVAFPEANPAKGITLQNEVKLDNNWLDIDFVFSFKKARRKPFAPNYAHLQAFFKF